VLSNDLDEAEVASAVDGQRQFRPPPDSQAQGGKVRIHPLPQPPQPPPPQPPPPQPLPPHDEPPQDENDEPHDDQPPPVVATTGGAVSTAGTLPSGPPARMPNPNRPIAVTRSGPVRSSTLRLT